VNVVVWVLQGVLAAAFVMAGVLKTTQPKDKLLPKLPWVEDFSTSTVRLIGTAELLGGLGLVAPAATGILPILTPVAAVALAVVMVLAAGTHARRREPSGVAVNAVLFVLLAIVARYRFGQFTV
jgi:uncharacterized membrane protein